MLNGLRWGKLGVREGLSGAWAGCPRGGGIRKWPGAMGLRRSAPASPEPRDNRVARPHARPPTRFQPPAMQTNWDAKVDKIPSSPVQPLKTPSSSKQAARRLRASERVSEREARHQRGQQCLGFRLVLNLSSHRAQNLRTLFTCHSPPPPTLPSPPPRLCPPLSRPSPAPPPGPSQPRARL